MPPVPVSLGPLARALALANIIAVIAAAVASAQHPVTGIGFAKVLGSNNIRVTSFDHKWTVGALGSHYAILILLVNLCSCGNLRPSITKACR